MRRGLARLVGHKTIYRLREAAGPQLGLCLHFRNKVVSSTNWYILQYDIYGDNEPRHTYDLGGDAAYAREHKARKGEYLSFEC